MALLAGGADEIASRGQEMSKGERKRALRGRAGRMKGGRGSGRASTGQVRLWGRHAVEAALKNPLRSHRKLWATREGAIASIATGLDWRDLTIRTLVNGRERQSYPASDMIFSPAEIVQHLSQDMTLMPGDVIAVGTSLGVRPVKAGDVVAVEIDGIGSAEVTLA